MTIGVLVITFLIVYTLVLINWDKYVVWRLSTNVSRAIKYGHYLSLFIVLTIAFAYSQFGVGLRGLWTTRTFIIFFLFTGVFFNLVTNKSILKRVEKIYFRLFSLLPTLTGIFLCIPFLGIVVVASLIGRIIDPVDFIHYEDQNLRIQSSFRSVLAPKQIDLFEKNAFYEKYIPLPSFNCDDKDSIAVHYDQDSTRIYIYEKSVGESKPQIVSLDKLN